MSSHLIAWLRMANSPISAGSLQHDVGCLETLRHFSVSSAMSLPNSAGVIGVGSTPTSASRAFSFVSARPALTSRLSLSTMSPGVCYASSLNWCRSRLSSHFAGLNDFREIALTEIQICSDDGGLVTVGRIEQIDRPLRQRVLRQQWHQSLLPDGRGHKEGRQLRDHIATERTGA